MALGGVGWRGTGVSDVFRAHLCPRVQRWQESQKSVVKNHPLREVLRPPLLRSTVLAMVLASVALIGTWGSVQWLPLWADKMAQEQGVRDALKESGIAPEAVAASVATASPAVLARAKELKDHNAKAYTQVNSALGAVLGCILGGWLG